MGKQYEEDDEEPEMTITVNLDDGTDLECAILTILEVDGRDYIALLPIDDEEDGEVLMYRYEESEEGEPSLDNILDDDEFEKVADAFDEWLDTQEFDEIVDADDLDEV
jgi:hypothetical protein